MVGLMTALKKLSAVLRKNGHVERSLTRVVPINRAFCDFGEPCDFIHARFFKAMLEEVSPGSDKYFLAHTHETFRLRQLGSPRGCR